MTGNATSERTEGEPSHAISPQFATWVRTYRSRNFAEIIIISDTCIGRPDGTGFS